MDEDSKEILFQIFDILGFSEEEKKKALLDFEKLVAAELLRSVQHELPEEYRDYMAKGGPAITDPHDPAVITLRDAVRKLHTKEEYCERGRKILKKHLPAYTDHVAHDLSAEKTALIEEQIGTL